MNNFLVGNTITDIKVSDDKRHILFICEDIEPVEHFASFSSTRNLVAEIDSVSLGKCTFPAEVLKCEKFFDCFYETPGLEKRIWKANYKYYITTDMGVITIRYYIRERTHEDINLEFQDEIEVIKWISIK